YRMQTETAAVRWPSSTFVSLNALRICHPTENIRNGFTRQNRHTIKITGENSTTNGTSNNQISAIGTQSRKARLFSLLRLTTATKGITSRPPFHEWHLRRKSLPDGDVQEFLHATEWGWFQRTRGCQRYGSGAL